MKWIYALAAVALFASSALAYDVEEEEGDARLGYFNVAGGVTTLTFNATSIQNAVILLLFVGLIGALIAPLLLGAGGSTPVVEPTGDAGYGYGYGQEQTGYADPSGYAGYAKRSLITHLSPVLEALSSGHKKYEEEEVPAAAAHAQTY